MNICNSHRREGKDVIEGGACRYCMEEEIAWAKAEERARILALVEEVFVGWRKQHGVDRVIGWADACDELKRRIEEAGA